MKDYIVRATAAEGQVRAFAATTKELVETAREHHNTSPVATAALGRLLTAGAMMGSMMKNETDMLTLQVRGDGPLGGITVTADSKGDVKGYVNNPDVMLLHLFKTFFPVDLSGHNTSHFQWFSRIMIDHIVFFMHICNVHGSQNSCICILTAAFREEYRLVQYHTVAILCFFTGNYFCCKFGSVTVLIK